MAFVLAHELGHFSGRDHLRGLSRQLSFQEIMALVFSSQGDMQLGASQAGQLASLAYSRKQEAAADRYAMTLLKRTRGTGAGAMRFFEVLEVDHLPPWAYMFNTHPATVERIKALRQQALDAEEPGGTVKEGARP